MDEVSAPIRHERVLLRNLGGGDRDAFWQLWMEHRLHLYSVCLRHMRGEAADAADAVSRSMLLAFKKLPAHASEIQNLQAWLTRLTRNVCVDMCRERQRLTSSSAATVDDILFEERAPVDPRPTPEDEALSNETYVTLIGAIDGLPPLLREVARMRFLHDTPYERIAELLSITEPTARKRVQQARIILRGAFTSRAARASLQ